MNLTPNTPWHLWVVGVLSLIWNGFGGWDYTQTQLQNREYIASMTEPMGISVDEAIAYYTAFPAWADALWALGVWGSVAGSLLLLLRNRFAFHAFVLSLVGLIGGMYYQFANPMPGLTDTTIPMVFSLVIFAIIAALIYYSKRMTARGVLR
ncbi:hypothetical protein P7228_02500 [Altererythrobacter arenosus]|uniref:Sugar transporter n=1 Tax=Altererythrobacter arenosus TaxID=3032592 RepID=A0ABY8FX26_9SPHN|nr:hypothetical protein [Altererythrobacter sp. CAU 1644]WFL77956.1 hypothetical protein P7228_02500 [Altererythrobacter sp. CAU 1644]